MSAPTETIHATSVAIGGRAVLLTGASGAGKSDLALRLIDRGATLVSDDYTELRSIDGRLIATTPASIAGRMEVRGLGIVAMPHVVDVPVALLVRLHPEIERLPEPSTGVVAGVAVAAVVIDPFRLAAPIKVELALKMTP